MIALYHCQSARSFRVLWMLEELGLPYELHLLPFPPRVHAREFLDLNPLGTVPFLVDGAVRMTESAAICQYLATRTGPTALAVEPGEPDHGAFLNWLHYGEATLTVPQTLVLRYRTLEPPERRQPQVAEDYARWFAARLRMLTTAVWDREHLCAGRFTAADVSVGYALMLAHAVGLAEGLPPPVRAYWDRLRARPAFSRALAQQNGPAPAFA
ncbi:MAG: glutathione S-transferase family protein [Actinomycetospora chiangmaiensis]|nr:glutathione S-transferase family protein [Actinomycetospora chiangmaiensis]